VHHQSTGERELNYFKKKEERKLEIKRGGSSVIIPLEKRKLNRKTEEKTGCTEILPNKQRAPIDDEMVDALLIAWKAGAQRRREFIFS